MSAMAGAEVAGICQVVELVGGQSPTEVETLHAVKLQAATQWLLVQEIIDQGPKSPHNVMLQ